jgi:hypothetical protein
MTGFGTIDKTPVNNLRYNENGGLLTTPITPVAAGFDENLDLTLAVNGSIASSVDLTKTNMATTDIATVTLDFGKLCLINLGTFFNVGTNTGTVTVAIYASMNGSTYYLLNGASTSTTQSSTSKILGGTTIAQSVQLRFTTSATATVSAKIIEMAAMVVDL